MRPPANQAVSCCGKAGDLKPAAYTEAFRERQTRTSVLRLTQRAVLVVATSG